MIYDAFIDGSSRGINPTFQLDKTLNAYLEMRSTEGAKTIKQLIAAPGSEWAFDLGDGPVRGQLSVEGYDFAVCAGNVWQKDPLDIITLLGTVANDGLPVKMVANTTQVLLRSAGIGYVIAAGAVAAIAAPPWTTLADIDMLGDYFIGLDDDGLAVGGQFFITIDATTWDPLDFGTAPSSNNKLRALGVMENALFIFGSITTQPFEDNGDPDFPIVPIKSGTMNMGTTARDSVVKLAKDPQSAGSTIFMLSETADGHAQVVKIVGFQLTVVSTPQLDRIFQGYSKISDAIGWAFETGGHVFYQINFPDAQASWRYDSTTNRWAQVSWYNQATGLQEAHRGVNHAFNNGRHLVGDRAYGILWLLSQDIYSDGDPTDSSVVVEQFMQREVLLPSEGTKRGYLNMAELLAETGVGDGTGSGAGDDPVVEIQFSGDGGRTWDDPDMAKLGKLGEYDTKVQWPRLGSGEQCAVRVTCTAPVKRVWSGLDIDMRFQR